MDQFIYRIAPTRIGMLASGPTQREAELIANDPAVQQGVMRAELLPFRVALWSNHGPQSAAHGAQADLRVTPAHIGVLPGDRQPGRPRSRPVRCRGLSPAKSRV